MESDKRIKYLEAELLLTLFSKLNNQSIGYCVLRNYDTLIYHASSDIDLWIQGCAQSAFQKILYQVAKDLNWVVLKPNVSPRLNRDGEGKYVLIHREHPDSVVQLDSWTLPYWRGIPYVDQEVLLRNRFMYPGGFYVATPGVEAAVSLIGDILHQRPLSERRKRRVTECLRSDNHRAFEASLSKPFGEVIAEHAGNLARTGKWSALQAKAGTLRRVLVWRAIVRNFPNQVRYWLTYLTEGAKYRLLWSDYGLFLAFIGPDGSGKSTLANVLLSSRMVKNTFARRYLFHRDFSILPKLREIARWIGVGSSNNTFATTSCIRETTPLPMIRSLIYPLYYGANNILAYFWLWKQRKNGGALIVLDRYFYEFMVQPTYRKCPRWLLRWITQTIPKPDIVVCLTADPEVIYSRKQELPRNEIVRQLRLYKEIAHRSGRALLLDSADSIEQGVIRIQQAMLSLMERRGQQ